MLIKINLYPHNSEDAVPAAEASDEEGSGPAAEGSELPGVNYKS